MTEADSANNIMKFTSQKRNFGLTTKARRHKSLVPFARTPNSNSYAGKFHDYHLSVNPFETTVFDDSVIINMVNEAKNAKEIPDDAAGDQELEQLLNKVRRFKGDSQRYT